MNKVKVADFEIGAGNPLTLLAGCLAAMGRDTDAKDQLETLLDMNPGNANAQELYARVAA